MSSLLSSIIRRNVSKTLVVPQFDPKVVEDVKNNVYKPRYHPGTRSKEVIKAPDKVHDATKIIVSKIQEHNLNVDGVKMLRYLKARHAPIEKSELAKNMHQLKDAVVNRIGLEGVDIAETYSDDDIIAIERGVQKVVTRSLKQQTYHWEPINYSDYIARVYLWNRFTPEYAVLKKVLEEIQKRVEGYKPHSVFDFGSGIGTAVWATYSNWSDSIDEFYCVDISVHMADLSSLLIQGGRQNRQPDIRNVVYRQFLPASTPNKYSLVICAYSLLELESQRQRIETLAKLWEKTEDFLIIVDHGNVAGSKVVLEARDYILGLNTKRPHTSHVFAPCPHDSLCPRSEKTHHCNFEVKFENNLTYIRGERDIRPETFCYMIFRRGARQDSDPQWPRLIRPVLNRSKHTVCKLCTKNGTVAPIVFSNRKHGLIEHRCAKGSKWGDLLPVSIHSDTVEINTNDTDNAHEEDVDEGDETLLDERKKQGGRRNV